MAYATGEESTAWGQGTRRKRFAGYLKAANELRQNYQASYAANRERQEEDFNDEELGIPGAFPDLKVARNGREEMVLFPSYARQHVKSTKKQPSREGMAGDNLQPNSGPGDAEYWQREWEIYEDANAIVDVDVRGWIYSPHKGPLNRKNRLMMGIARKLSGIPAPGESQPSSRSSSRIRERHEDELVEREAQSISQKGTLAADVAGRGGYSEGKRNGSTNSSRDPSPKPGDLQHPLTDSSIASSASIEKATALGNRISGSQVAEMTVEELKMANRHLISRIKPFLSNPSIGMDLTVFFYNDKTSQSRTARTNESGHFNLRAALNFVPTNLKVLASEDLSASEEVLITDPTGISLISDIDDTIKHSAIGAGAREIFRNAFVRELGDLTIDGVRQWYEEMSELGVKMHYVSNSPWQMYPLLVSYFAKAGLPPGSFHLKQYSGMLQGIFEPVAERKRSTLDRILSDFPKRKFILVGDSGEADLEVYTETAIMNPGRILGIFIRDVTTSPKQGFFDSNGGPRSRSPFRQRPNANADTVGPKSRPSLPPRPVTAAVLPKSDGSDLGDLIDFDDNYESVPPSRIHTEPIDEPLTKVQSSGSSKSTPPAPPRKPVALRTKSSELSTETLSQSDTPLPVIRKPAPNPPPKPTQLSQSTSLANQNTDSVSTKASTTPSDQLGYRAYAYNKISNAYNSLPSTSAYLSGTNQPPPNKNPGSSVRAISSSTKPPPVPTSSKPASLLSRTPTSSTVSSSFSTATSSSATPSTLYQSSPHHNASAPPAPPPRRGLASYPAAAAQYASNKWYGTEEQQGQQAVDSNGQLISKKEELWNRRWVRAKEVCEKKGIVLKSWRVGADAQGTARGLVEKALRER